MAVSHREIDLKSDSNSEQSASAVAPAKVGLLGTGLRKVIALGTAVVAIGGVGFELGHSGKSSVRKATTIPGISSTANPGIENSPPAITPSPEAPAVAAGQANPNLGSGLFNLGDTIASVTPVLESGPAGEIPVPPLGGPDMYPNANDAARAFIDNLNYYLTVGDQTSLDVASSGNPNVAVGFQNMRSELGLDGDALKNRHVSLQAGTGENATAFAWDGSTLVMTGGTLDFATSNKAGEDATTDPLNQQFVIQGNPNGSNFAVTFSGNQVSDVKALSFTRIS